MCPGFRLWLLGSRFRGGRGGGELGFGVCRLSGFSRLYFSQGFRGLGGLGFRGLGFIGFRVDDTNPALPIIGNIYIPIIPVV